MGGEPDQPGSLRRRTEAIYPGRRLRYFLFAREFGIKPSELDKMRLDEIDLLEKGLEDQAAEIDRINKEAPEGASPSPTARADGKPLSAADERIMEIARYEAEQHEKTQEMTSAERLASMGVTVTSASEADEA